MEANESDTVPRRKRKKRALKSSGGCRNSHRIALYRRISRNRSVRRGHPSSGDEGECCSMAFVGCIELWMKSEIVCAA